MSAEVQISGSSARSTPLPTSLGDGVNLFPNYRQILVSRALETLKAQKRNREDVAALISRLDSGSVTAEGLTSSEFNLLNLQATAIRESKEVSEVTRKAKNKKKAKELTLAELGSKSVNSPNRRDKNFDTVTPWEKL